jgi:hypothetical protein
LFSFRQLETIKEDNYLDTEETNDVQPHEYYIRRIRHRIEEAEHLQSRLSILNHDGAFHARLLPMLFGIPPRCVELLLLFNTPPWSSN